MYLPGLVCGTSELGDVLGLEGTRCVSFGTEIKKNATIKVFQELRLTEGIILKKNTCLWDPLETQKACVSNGEVWMSGIQRNSADGEPL